MDNYWENFKTPFVCFAGHSGVGKTTLLVELTKRFQADKIRVGYYKHDSHRFVVDRKGKDTARCARAGAEIVTINDPTHFAVIGDGSFKKMTISHALEQCDCILIEGYKQSPFNKVVFLDEKGKLPIPADSPGIQAIVHQGNLADWPQEDSRIPLFHRDEVERIYKFVKSHFYSCTSPLYGVVFVGGQSRRMGKPKFSLSYTGKPEFQRMAEILAPFCEQVFLSSRSDQNLGEIPALVNGGRIDDEHVGLGPVGGLATLMSRFPKNAWLITACDLPFMTKRDLEKLVRERDPFKYGTCYIKKGRFGFEPMFAIYEPKFIFPLFQAMSRRELSLSLIISELPFKHIKVEEADRSNFTNVNHPEEYELAKLKRENKIQE
ncbi:MAG: molybdopterin-guanine dinucleotide biosynthesis protein B [Nitrospinota bacterium]|nr:molybdopterin-guanine dinucleotide biosynthesis protein B [Nitrospinota bacterium]